VAAAVLGARGVEQARAPLGLDLVERLQVLGARVLVLGGARQLRQEGGGGLEAIALEPQLGHQRPQVAGRPGQLERPLQRRGGGEVVAQVEEVVEAQVVAVAPIARVVGDAALEQRVGALDALHAVGEPHRGEAVGVVHPGVEVAHELDQAREHRRVRVHVAVLAAHDLDRLEPVVVGQQVREAERGGAGLAQLGHEELAARGGRRGVHRAVRGAGAGGGECRQRQPLPTPPGGHPHLDSATRPAG
jgi:hypothetical protein